MKAFSAEIFTDQAQEELIKEAKSLLAQNPKYIRSILEAEDDCIVRELQLKRDAYISLLESQKQDLGLINEAAGLNVTTGIMVAIIALISYIITGIILGKKDSTPPPPSSSSSGSAHYSRGYNSGYDAGKKAGERYQKAKDDADRAWEEYKRNQAERERQREERRKRWEEEDKERQRRYREEEEKSRRAHEEWQKKYQEWQRKYGGSSSSSSGDFHSKYRKGTAGSDWTSQEKKKTGANSIANKVMDGDNQITSADDIKFGREVKGGGHSIMNPYWCKDRASIAGFEKRNGITFDAFKQAATRTNVEVNALIFPDLDLCLGNTNTVNDLVSLTDDVNSTLISIWQDETELSTRTKKQVDEAIQKIENIKDASKHDFSNIDEGLSNKKQINAAEFLQKKYDCFEWSRASEASKDGDVALPGKDFGEPTNLVALRRGMQKCLDRANDIKYNPDNKEMVDAVQNINKELVEFRKCLVDVAKDINTACKKYRSCTGRLAADLNSASRAVVSAAKVNESAIWSDDFITLNEAMMIGDPRYTENPMAIEEAFGWETTMSGEEAIFEQFYSGIDDTIDRMSLYIHQMETRAVNEEALIFSETGISDYEKFQRLQAVNEALGDKVKKAWYNSIAAIKQIFSKFIEKLNANFTTTKHYLEQYKKVILTSPFKADDTYNTQNLDLGIKRIYNAECPALNYQNVVNGDYETVGAFFNKVLYRNIENDNSLKVPGDDASAADVSNFFKAYFCMQDHEQTYTGPQFQKNIKEYYNFLYDIRKINDTIKKSIKSIEDTADRVLKQAGATAQAAQAGEGQATEKQESMVYSYLYQTYLTLNEDGILVEADINSGTQANAPSSTMKNVAQNQDDDTKQIQGADKSVADTKIKIYVDCCSAMLKAKMSACEFIRNELMQIIRHHVQSYIGPQANQQSQSQKANNQQQNKQQQTQQTQQQTTQQTQQTGQKENIFTRAGRAFDAARASWKKQ